MKNDLIDKLSKYSLKDAIFSEEKDRQYIAVSKIYSLLGENVYYFPLIITNAIVGYQLSGKGEDYWEEFQKEIEKNISKFNKGGDFLFSVLFDFFNDFLPNSKCNKRLLNMKIPRIMKLQKFFLKNIGNYDFFYKNLIKFQEDIAFELKQSKEDKTILFAVKMFYYGAKNYFSYQNIIPFEIGIPLDSRLLKLENIYNNSGMDRQDFWKYISKEINIPPLHLDGIIWTNCKDFICI